MGIWDNVKENVRDIGGGIGSVFRGKPTTDRERDITRKQKQFEELRKNPIPDTSGYTPVKDSYGRVTYSGGGGSSRGSSGGGGSGSNAQARAEAERKRQAEIARQEQIRKQQEEAQRLADQLKSEREQKAFGQTIGGQVKPKTSGQINIKETQKGLNQPFGTRTDYKFRGSSFGNAEKISTGGFVNNTVENIPTTPENRAQGLFGGVSQKQNMPSSSTTQKIPTSSVASSLINPLVFARDIVVEKAKKTKDIVIGGGKALWSKEVKIPIFGLGTGAGVPGGSVGMKNVSKGLSEEFGTAGEVASIILPKTYGETAVLTAAPFAYKALPPVGKIITSTYLGVTGTKTVLDPTATKPERIIGGTVGVLGFTGAAFEATPFVKGGLARLSPKYKPVATQTEGFKAVSTKDPIGLIKPKAPLKSGATTDVKLPSTSSLKRGGFGVTPKDKPLYLGGDQKLATSQQSFFKQGKDIILDREFFVTPQDPTIKIATARISRLGLSNPFKPTPSATLSFGLPKTPQIGVEVGGVVSRTGKGTTWKLGLGSELEAIKGAGTVVSGVKKTGITSIWGQAVDLYSFKTGPSGLVKGASSLPTTATTTTTSGYGVVSTLLGVPTRKPSTSSAPTIKPTPVITQPSRPTSRPTKPTFKPTPVITQPSRPTSRPNVIPTYPIIPRIYPTIIPTFKPTPFVSKPSRPTAPYSPYGSSLLIPSSSNPLVKTRPWGLLPKTPRIKEKPKAKRQLFTQPTAYQPSFSGSILNLKGTGAAPGGLSLRGLINFKEKEKKKKKRFWWE